MEPEALSDVIEYALFATLLFIPTWFILKKSGLNPYLSLLSFIPMGPLAITAILAFKKWQYISEAD